MRRHRDHLQPLSEINVTNLLDTAFTLIIAFMMVAPTVQHGLKLELPEVSGENLDNKKTVTVAIAPPELAGQTDRIYLDDRRVTPEELTDLLVDMKGRFKELDVVIESDKAITYDTFATTLGAVKEAGIQGIGLITDPTEAEEDK